jgi:hypothetical protein
VFVAVKLVWEPPNDGLSRGFSAEGHALAQVAHVFNAAGDTGGEHYSNVHYSVAGCLMWLTASGIPQTHGAVAGGTG